MQNRILPVLLLASLAACTRIGIDPTSGSSANSAGGASTSSTGGGGVGGSPPDGSSSVAATSSTGSVSPAAVLGIPCTSDADCGPLTCVTADGGKLDGEGVQGGMCSKVCVGNSNCTAIAADAHCIAWGTARYCMQDCTAGAATPASAKCRGRGDMACNRAGNFDVCLPACSSSAACGAGLYCNFDTGLCHAGTKTGLPMGSSCNPNASPSECQSNSCLCLDGSCTTAMCTGLCVNDGPLLGCGFPDDPGACTLIAYDDTGAGDAAYCTGLCDCDADCTVPGFKCNKYPASEQQKYGHKGECFTPYTTTLPTCPP